MAKTYIVAESGGNWIVSERGREITRYSTNDLIGFSGAVDIRELEETIRSDLRLDRRDRVIVED